MGALCGIAFFAFMGLFIRSVEHEKWTTSVISFVIMMSSLVTIGVTSDRAGANNRTGLQTPPVVVATATEEAK